MAEHAAGRTTFAPSTGDSLLAEIVSRLVATYHPERIYLFGSHARDAAHGDSDYDLMVVVGDDAPASLQRSTPGYDALWGLPRGGDILVWTRTAFEQRLHLRASLPSTISGEGRLLYHS
jgi:nucleotidyltransferase-like protein